LENAERERRQEAEEMRVSMKQDIADTIDVARREAIFVAGTAAMERFFVVSRFLCFCVFFLPHL
jgi:hypothetical protein